MQRNRENANSNKSETKIPAPETILVHHDSDEVKCDGGGVLGHPVVWYSFDGRDRVDCGYCDRLFVKRT